MDEFDILVRDNCLQNHKPCMYQSLNAIWKTNNKCYK